MNPLRREGCEWEGFQCQVSLGSEEVFHWILPSLFPSVMQDYQTTVQWDLVSLCLHIGSQKKIQSSHWCLGAWREFRRLRALCSHQLWSIPSIQDPSAARWSFAQALATFGMLPSGLFLLLWVSARHFL